MRDSLTIRKIQAGDCYELRQRVLRPGFPIESVNFPEDQLPGTFHLGAFNDQNKLICVASFMPQKNENFDSEKPYRLRGMAAHPDAQGKGVGLSLMKHAIQELKTLHCDLLWCDARTSALGFYGKLGMKTHGPEFKNPIGIPHFVMFTRL